MKILSAIALALTCLAANIGAAAAAINQPAPAFSALDSYGNRVSLGDYADKMVILEWTNHLCPFVQKHYDSGSMQALQKKYTGQGVVWLSVISSAEGKQGHVSPEQANQLTGSREAMPSAVLIDAEGKMGRLYGAKTTPHMYIIDRQGILRYMGAIDSIRSANTADIPRATNYLDKGMSELLAGRPVSEAVTRAYGCTVKY